MPLCPTCGKEAQARPQNPSGPFCSVRCRQIDLGKWFAEEFRVATDETPDEDAVNAAVTDGEK
jgi:endogenous inhibitor of DNA gyrase (YacG/DUF329 family)